jgi:RimJ/RimL family protein N-acetyltransferase
VIGIIGYEGASNSELGYWLGEDYWGKGILSEAARAVVRHAFTVSGNERLVSRCILGNEPSRRILIGLGFRPVGISSLYSSAGKSAVTSQEFELTSREWRIHRRNYDRNESA